MHTNHRRLRRRAWTVVVALVVTSFVGATPADAQTSPTSLDWIDQLFGQSWPTAGHDRTGNRNNPDERILNPDNVDQLTELWRFTTGSDIAATPSVDRDRVYFPDFAGNVYALDRDTGAQVWRASVPAITGVTGDFARTTPALVGPLLLLGNQGGSTGRHDVPGSGGGWIFALNKNTGQLVWKNKIESHFAALITQSIQVQDTTGYVGVSSSESTYFKLTPNVGDYVCCTFRGSMVAFDVITGRVRWKTYTTPPGMSGVAVWGTVPAVDPIRRLVLASGGNNYSASPEVIACLQANPDNRIACSPPGNHFDSMIAFNMDTGRVVWSAPGWDSDVWNGDCLPLLNPNGPGPNCPPEGAVGPDYDFSQAPALLRVPINGRMRDVAGAGQKSGHYTLVDRTTGQRLWRTEVGPGGQFGGLQWGSATDGERIYVANSNSGNLTAADLSQPGTYAALDPSTGEILWQIDDPGHQGIGFSGQGAVSVANGVVYACSTSPRGEMFALDAATGELLWIYPSGGTCIAGAAVVDGTIYWGSGYRRWAPLMTGNNIFRAFGLPT